MLICQRDNLLVILPANRAHEAANQNSTPQRAWRWLYNITNTLLQRLSGTPPEQLWNYPPDMPEVQENQHLLLQQQKEGVCMSDKHMFELPSPLPAMIDPMALAGGTSGGASVVVSRSSRGHNRGQLSSCATSSEHLVGVGGDVANSLACLSMHSHTTQHSYLPYDLSEGLMMEAQELALLEQKVCVTIIRLTVKAEVILVSLQGLRLLLAVIGCSWEVKAD